MTTLDRSFWSSERTFGARRVWDDVPAEGLNCGLPHVERVMQENGLRRVQVAVARLRIEVNDSSFRRPVLPRVVGWAMKAEMTAQPVTDALLMVIRRRGKPISLLHHSVQGSQYTSEQFQRMMAGYGITCSMCRSGNVWDNAARESFFSSLNTERCARKI